MNIKAIVVPDFITIDDSATLSELIGKLQTQERRSALVFRDKKYIGLIEKKKLLRARIDASKAKLAQYVQNTPVLSEATEVPEAVNLMFESDSDFLPVERSKALVGVIDGLQLAKLALELPGANKLKVKDLKFLIPPVIRMKDPVAAVINTMHDTGADPVPLFEGATVVGVVSYRDLLRKYLNWTPQRDFSKKFNKMISGKGAEVDMPHLASLPVSNFSTNFNLFTTKPTESLATVLGQMSEKRVRSLIVLDKGEFRGLVTVKTILQTLAALKDTKNYNVQYIGLAKLNLTEHQLASIERIVATEAPKLERHIHNTFTLALHLKEYGKGGKQSKFSVHMRMEYPGRLITCEEDDWKLETALHKTFENARNAVKNQFKGDGKKVKGMTKEKVR